MCQSRQAPPWLSLWWNTQCCESGPPTELEKCCFELHAGYGTCSLQPCRKQVPAADPAALAFEHASEILRESHQSCFCWKKHLKIPRSRPDLHVLNVVIAGTLASRFLRPGTLGTRFRELPQLWAKTARCRAVVPAALKSSSRSPCQSNNQLVSC